MKTTDNVGVTFVNTVINQGVLNGVINVNLGVFQFSPSEDGEKIEADPAVACRLRMDKVCAMQLHNAIGGILAKIESDQSAAMAAAADAQNEMPRGAEEKLN
jgi:hypothetical protein